MIHHRKRQSSLRISTSEFAPPLVVFFLFFFFEGQKKKEDDDDDVQFRHVVENNSISQSFFVFFVLD